MKRFLIVLLCLIQITGIAAADLDLDLTKLSYDDLIYLQKSVSEEIMTRDEFRDNSITIHNKSIQKEFPFGLFLILKTETGTVMLTLSDQLYNFKTKLELILQEAQGIQINP